MENLPIEASGRDILPREIPMTSDHKGVKLTKNENLVYQALCQSGQAVGAYDILDQLRPKGVSAPPTVYRALAQLIEKGLVKRIESTRKFVQAQQLSAQDAIAVCNSCGQVSSFPVSGLALDLEEGATNSGFRVDGFAVEVIGECGDCMNLKSDSK